MSFRGYEVDASDLAVVICDSEETLEALDTFDTGDVLRNLL